MARAQGPIFVRMVKVLPLPDLVADVEPHHAAVLSVSSETPWACLAANARRRPLS